MIKDSTPFISVDHWTTLADIFIDTRYKNGKNDYDYSKEFQDVFKKKNPIIFLKTDFIPFFIDKFTSFKESFILITASNDDHCVPDFHVPSQNKEIYDKCIKLLNKSELIKWYTKNPGIVHDKLIGFPLGPKWQWKTTRFFGENKEEHMRIYSNLCLEPEKKFYDKALKPNLLYLNFAQTTSKPFFAEHTGIRHTVKNILSKKFKFQACTNFENYMHELRSYKFCISPPGRGIDTHRAWEALMMGTIPIMISTTQDHLFEKLPVVIVSNWEDINVQFLNNKYEELIQKTYDFDILYTSYWDNLINIDKHC
jgi:hypothetical protein